MPHARCRSLAAKADEFTEMRLLALAERYESLLREEIPAAPASISAEQKARHPS
jgi:hypothetical protein